MKGRLNACALAALLIAGCAQAPQRPPGAPSEASRPADLASAAAAVQLVRQYGALVHRRRWVAARGLWGDPAAAAAFEATLRQFSEAHLDVVGPGHTEGAAGSIFITVPVIFYGPGAHGSALRRAADITLRRVNDVPGSTAAQRRWHIERIEWTSGP